MITWESSVSCTSRRCSYKDREADLWADSKNWNLCIQTLTRISPKESYDVSVGWSKRMGPLLEEAILKAEEILRAEWQLSSTMQSKEIL